MSQEKKQAIKLKMAKARSFFNEADILLENKFYATVINRLYYACFHATKALLLTRDLIPKTHSGVINMLHQHFVAQGQFEIKHAAFLSRLLQQRIEEDYSDLIIEDEENTKALIEPAREYITYVESLIQNNI